MAKRERLIVLRSGGVIKVTLSDASILAMDDAERVLVFGIIDKMAEYEAATKVAAGRE